ncbi:MAG: YgjV family protein [Bdellovibrionales bacterium]
MIVFSLPSDHPLSYIQIVGYIGMALGIFVFLQRDDRRLKLSMVVMTAVMVIHFVLLGRYVAAISAASAGSRAGLSLIPFVMRHRHYFAAFFVVLTCVLGVVTYSEWFDSLPFMAALLGTYSFFYLKGLWLRCSLLVGGTFWLLHNIMALSYGPAVMEVFILSANAYTIFILLHERKKTAV